MNNYSIVASRGELARNNYAVRETSSAQCIVVKRNKTAVNVGSETRPKVRDDLLKEQSSGKQLTKDIAGSTDFGKSQRLFANPFPFRTISEKVFQRRGKLIGGEPRRAF